MNTSHKRARHNMVEQQIRAWEVLDENVLSLYDDIGLLREKFIVEEANQALAYADMALPIGNGQCMLEPKLEARMLQALLPHQGEKILHIGCGSGYFAALLGKLAGQVFSVELNPALAAAATARLQLLDDCRVTVINADGVLGLPKFAPYDAIVLTGSVAQVPTELFRQLTETGRLLAVVGDAPAMHLRLYEKQTTGDILWRDILETVIPPLENAHQKKSFSF